MSSTGDNGSCFVNIATAIGNTKLLSRLKELKHKFVSTFGEDPDVYIRIPGRVNLIGEHVDYCGYSVCPMAIELDILLAAKVVESETFLQVTNVDPAFKDCTVTDENFSISIEQYGWCGYVMCGVRGALERLGKPSLSLRFAIAGNIPPGSGLSSSSALVCASFLATTYLNKLTLPRIELAALSADCERYIGTVGGGMDQAIAFCANEGSSKHIEFNPLKTADVSLPKDAVFVVANSLVVKNKALSNDFNARVVETRLVAKVLAKHQNINYTGKLVIADVQAKLNISIDKMVSLVKEIFHEEPYTIKELCQEFGKTENELAEEVLTPNTRHLKTFELRKRGLHVTQEAQRVSQWLKASTVKELGLLMDESHKSLRELYEASHPSLDALVAVCKKGGALGARLTGAGWGGAVVAVTTPSNVTPLLQTIASSYYNGRTDLEGILFATKPGPGAQMFTVL